MADFALLGIGDVGAVVIEGRQRADHAAHDRHGVRVAAEAAEEAGQLLMHHGVAGDGVVELRHLVGGRQFSVQQQVAAFQEGGMFGQVANGIAAILQHALVAIDEGDVGLGRGGRGEAGIVGEDVGLVVELADVDDVGALRAGEYRQLEILAFIVKAGLARRLDLALSHACPLAPACRVYLAPQ